VFCLGGCRGADEQVGPQGDGEVAERASPPAASSTATPASGASARGGLPWVGTKSPAGASGAGLADARPMLTGAAAKPSPTTAVTAGM
jgi:hypothetical protein